ncbi:esterase [Pedobacter polaris]|uniref:Esterase n=1 Tax=Pedobacter polaris TaxID=2571273 RepID=A0A4U1CNC3_9SPHI|nr:alpha/beta hydrolase-fold protein [Pedobacter polaris]TKC08088.1 esterase [Pedobacter polaris]
MKREYHKWFSNSLQRDMELLVFGHSGKAVLFFPTRMARFYDYENWGVVDALREQIESGSLQLFCVDSVDAESFYNRDEHPEVRIARHQQYEGYLVNEVVQLIYKVNDGGFIQTAGCSMGAYHAVNIAMKYPWLFRRAVGLSGRYDLTRNFGDFRDLLDGHHNEAVYFSMPLQFVPNLADGYLLSELQDLEVVLAVGREDPFLQGNIEFKRLLSEKELPSQLHIWEGNAHRAADWKRMAPIYF